MKLNFTRPSPSTAPRPVTVKVTDCPAAMRGMVWKRTVEPVMVPFCAALGVISRGKLPTVLTFTRSAEPWFVMRIV